MGYYCTVPQCTSLAGKTKNVKFHRFPRDVVMADKWNIILKRGKPYTKYSKVCSLHFTQSDYNVTTMGQWKTLSKEAVPSQNLPKCNPDGTPMVIRKSRTIKCKITHVKKELDFGSEKPEDKWPQASAALLHNMASSMHESAHTSAIHETALVYNRIQQSLHNLAQTAPLPPPIGSGERVGKQDAMQQTEPCGDDDVKRREYSDDEYDQIEPFSGQGTSASQFQKENSTYNRNEYEIPKDYTKNTDEYHNKESDYEKSTPTTSADYQKNTGDYQKNTSDYQKSNNDYSKASDDFLPQTNEEYNKEAEKYALERKGHFDKIEPGYHKSFPTYPKIQDVYSEYNRDFQEKNPDYPRYHDYQNGYADPDLLRQHQQPITSPGFFTEGHIKQEIDLSGDDDKYLYERSKEAIEASSMYEQQRLMQQRLLDHVKTEPDTSGGSGCNGVMQVQDSPYFQGGNLGATGYYQQYGRQQLGPELLIAKQNALAAHTQLWQNTMKRPFFYSDSPHYNGSQLLQRYDDVTRISQ